MLMSVPPSDSTGSASPPVLGAIHAALRPHFEVIREGAVDIRVRYSARSVHQVRVCARRLRAGIRLFRRDLAATSGRELAERLRELLAVLGSARDADVWLDRLRDRAAAGILSAHPQWPEVVAREQSRQKRIRAQAAAYLASPSWQKLSKQLECFFAQDLPPPDSQPRLLLPAHACKKLRRQLRPLAARKKPLRPDSADRIHDFRRACRRARYWAEFLTPALGPPGGKLRVELTAVADALGRLRDADLAVRQLARRRCWWAGRLRDRAEQQAAQAERDFNRQWKRFRRDFSKISCVQRAGVVPPAPLRNRKGNA